MKTLYLVRHAKSSWKYLELDDFERPLNKRGRKNAPLMGKVLTELKVAPDLIVCSPASRAAMTARIIAAQIDYHLEKIRYSEAVYDSSEDGLLQVIKQIGDGVNKAMLVGHNPSLTAIANIIGDRPLGNIPTCGVYGLDLNISSWAKLKAHCGKSIFFEFPRSHKS